MPQTPRPAPPTAETTPVPVAILLPHPFGPPSSSPATDLPDWYGVQARELAGLITGYTRRGDVVATLDAHPTVLRAVDYLGRHAAVLTTDHQVDRAYTSPHARRLIRHRGAALILAGLPGPTRSTELPSIVEAITAWRGLLGPGGHLLIAVTAQPTDDEPVSARVQAILAARAAGLIWQQEFLVPLTPLPEYEPRAMPDTAAHTTPALAHGRHRHAHIKLLAFATQTGDAHA